MKCDISVGLAGFRSVSVTTRLQKCRSSVAERLIQAALQTQLKLSSYGRGGGLEQD